MLRKKAGIGIPLDSPELPPQPPLLSEGEAAVELELLTEFLLFGGILELIHERYYYYGVFSRVFFKFEGREEDMSSDRETFFSCKQLSVSE